MIQQKLEAIWGNDRAIVQTANISPLDDTSFVNNKVSISFNRLIYEDQIDDLSEMIAYMIRTLEDLKICLS